MEKGKIKKEEKHISVLFIPHFSANVKSVRFSALYTKVIAVGIIFVLIISSMFLVTVFSVIENRKLKNEKVVLSNVNAEQHRLLQEKADEIKDLLVKEEQFNSKAKELMERFRQITGNYVNGSTKPSRSGESITRSFVTDVNELKTILNDIKNMSATEDVLFDGLSDIGKQLEEYIEKVPTLWPTTGSITSDFGQRIDPFVWRKSNHTGIDIAAPTGTGIKAAASGKVILAKKISIYGRAILLDHGLNLKTFYGHASKLLVKEGQTVKKGDVIAYVGSTGRSTGPHLHFEVRVNDTSVNPLKYLDSK